MKKLTALVLALVLALTMLAGALAEAADLTGDWYGSLMGAQVTLTVNEDGTYKLDIAGLSQEEGVWEKDADGNLVMDKGTAGEGLVTVTETGLHTEMDSVSIDFTREPAETVDMTISEETTLEELQGKWQATSVVMGGMTLPMTLLGAQNCVIEVKDSSLYLLDLLGQTTMAEYEIPMTFASGILGVAMQVDENTTQTFALAKTVDGTVLFEIVMGDMAMDFLMEAVPAEEAAAE